MDHKPTGTDTTGLSFKDKLKTLNFGIVPGGYRDRNSTSMVDHESLKFVPTKEETEDRASTARRKIREASAEV